MSIDWVRERFMNAPTQEEVLDYKSKFLNGSWNLEPDLESNVDETERND